MNTKITFTKSELEHMRKAVKMVKAIACDENDRKIADVLAEAEAKLSTALKEMEDRK